MHIDAFAAVIGRHRLGQRVAVAAADAQGGAEEAGIIPPGLVGDPALKLAHILAFQHKGGEA